MSTIKLLAGAVTTFTAIMTTELNSLVTGNAIIGTTAIDNATNLDLEVECSFTTGASITPSGSPFVGLYFYPLNGDGTTYGDGRFGSSAAGPPPSNYYAGFCGLPAAAGTQTGTFGRPFVGSKITLPRGQFKPVFFNFTGVTLSASGNILYYKTTNRQVV